MIVEQRKAQMEPDVTILILVEGSLQYRLWNDH